MLFVQDMQYLSMIGIHSIDNALQAKGIDMDFSHCSIGCPKNNLYIEEHEMANKILNLPFYYELSDKEMKKVVEVINSIH